MHSAPILTGFLCLAAALAAPYGPRPELRKRVCSNSTVRYEWNSLSEAQKQAYLNAENCLFNTGAATGLSGASNRIEDLAAVHQAMSSIIHGVGQFLPWHRYMLHTHEYLLQSLCGYSGGVPWWDETQDAGHFDQSPLFTANYFGSAPLLTANGSTTCITDGAFANQYLTVGPGTSNINHCLSRGINNGNSGSITDSTIAACNSNTDFWAMSQSVDYGPHGEGHDAVGGVMGDVDSSPGDPIFYMHHAFLDRNWANWQAVSSSNAQAVGGPTTQNCGSSCVNVTSSYVLSIYNIIADATVSDVLDTQGGYLCYTYE